MIIVYFLGSGFRDGLITRSESYRCVYVCFVGGGVRLILCDLESSKMRRIRAELGCCITEQKDSFGIQSVPTYLAKYEKYIDKMCVQIAELCFTDCV